MELTALNGRLSRWSIRYCICVYVYIIYNTHERYGVRRVYVNALSRENSSIIGTVIGPWLMRRRLGAERDFAYSSAERYEFVYTFCFFFRNENDDDFRFVFDVQKRARRRRKLMDLGWRNRVCRSDRFVFDTRESSRRIIENYRWMNWIGGWRHGGYIEYAVDRAELRFLNY